jgi:hypothetical protein
MHTLHDRTLGLAARAHVLAGLARQRVARSTRAADERGEGVISAAIAVLIMAILGGLMFYAYKAIFSTSSERVNSIVTDLSNQSITG